MNIATKKDTLMKNSITKNIRSNPSVFIDIDDVILSTHETILEEVLRAGVSLTQQERDCVYRCSEQDWFNQIVNSVFERGRIPFKEEKVKEHLQVIKELYPRVFLITDQFLPMEYFFKLKLSEELGIPVIFTHGNKHLVPEKGDIFIDDRSDYLATSKASCKLCMFTPFNYSKKDKGVVLCKNWNDIMEVLT